VLLFRKAALVLVAVFAPIAFAGSAWDQTRVWTRRWLEVLHRVHRKTSAILRHL
jgi:hypothetical protein